MSKSVSAKIYSHLLQYWPKLSVEESEQKMLKALEEGDKLWRPEGRQ